MSSARAVNKANACLKTTSGIPGPVQRNIRCLAAHTAEVARLPYAENGSSAVSTCEKLLDINWDCKKSLRIPTGIPKRVPYGPSVFGFALFRFCDATPRSLKAHLRNPQLDQGTSKAAVLYVIPLLLRLESLRRYPGPLPPGFASASLPKDPSRLTKCS